MIYSFEQNNSGGYYAKPAQTIIVIEAKDAKHATEIAIGAGMYRNGVADGVDCKCCGDRWNGISEEYDNVKEAIIDANRSFHDEHNSIPKYIITDDLDIHHTVLEQIMGEGYYGVSDEFIMFVIVPCLIGLVCFICSLGDGYGDQRIEFYV